MIKLIGKGADPRRLKIFAGDKEITGVTKIEMNIDADDKIITAKLEVRIDWIELEALEEVNVINE